MPEQQLLYPDKVPIFLGMREASILSLGVRVLLEDEELGGDKGPTTKELKDLQLRLQMRKKELRRMKQYQKEKEEGKEG